MLKSKFVSEVPKWIRNLEDFPFAMGYCAPRSPKQNIHKRIPVSIIDRTLLFASIYDEEEMLDLINKVPIHELCHMFDRSAEW